MESNYIPKVGDYGCVKTSGFFGFLIRLGTFSRWNHAFIYAGYGKIIEANPRGVAFSSVSEYPKIAWNQHEELNDVQREAIVFYADQTVGAPYDFFTIAVIALRSLGLKALANTRLLKNLAKNRGYICSELVAESYRKAGIVLAKEDYLCTPGDLAERLVWQ